MGVRVDLRSLTVSCAAGAVLKGTITSWSAYEAGVITCAVDPPPSGLARKVHVTYC